MKLLLVNVFTVFRFHSMSSTYPHGIARSHRSMRSRLFCNPEICSKISPALLPLIFLACSNRAASGHSRTSVLKLCTHCGSRVLTSIEKDIYIYKREREYIYMCVLLIYIYTDTGYILPGSMTPAAQLRRLRSFGFFLVFFIRFSFFWMPGSTDRMIPFNAAQLSRTCSNLRSATLRDSSV